MIEAALDAAAFAFSAAYILNNPELSSRRMTKKSRTSFCLLFQPLPSAAALVFLFLPASCAFAQAPAGGTGTPATTGPGSNAPGATGPAPGVSSGIPRPAPNKPLSLSDVVNIAVGTNSGLVLAQQRKLFPQSELWLLGVQPFLATCDMKLACDFSALSFIAIRKIIFFMLKTLLNFKA